MKKYLTILTALLGSLELAAVHIGFMMPSGARQGSSVEIIIGGQKLYGIDNVYISGSGVSVETVETVHRPPNPGSGQRRYIYKWLNQIHKGDPRKPPLPESTEGWRPHPWFERLHELSDGERDILYRSLYVPQNSLQTSPAISGRVLLRLNIAPDAAPGERELRLVARGRVSNPLKFFVGKTPEVRESYFVRPPAQPHIPHFNIPAVLNGQIMPGECDKFTFEAKKGEKITFAALGRYLMPFIGDGVPGHFQMVLEVFNAQKQSVAYADDCRFDPDPVLTFTAPETGRYTLAVRDALYRGREDFVYRITAFRGSPAPLKLTPPRIPDVKLIDTAAIGKNTILTPGIMIKDTLRTAAGNSYRFHARKGQTVMVELYARRQGSPADGVLMIYDASGKLLADNDDTPRLKAGTILHGAADPMIRFTAPADGVYTVKTADVTGKYGDEYGYFLRISPMVPHFAVYVIPSAIKVNRNGWSTATLAVERYDGFDGEIKLNLRHRNIFIAGTQSIPAGVNRAMITLQARNISQDHPETVKLTASGGGFTTTAVPGDEMMQAFAYTHIAPAKNFMLSIQRGQPGLEKFSWAKSHPAITLDKDIALTANISCRNNPENASAELIMVDPPAWLKARPGDAHIAKPGTLKSGRKFPPHPLTLTLYADRSGKGKTVNQIFKIVYTYPRTDRNGKVKNIVQETILPAIQINGGK